MVQGAQFQALLFVLPLAALADEPPLQALQALRGGMTCGVIDTRGAGPQTAANATSSRNLE